MIGERRWHLCRLGFAFSVLVVLCVSPAVFAEDALKDELTATLGRYELFFLQDFDVKVKSAEINAVLSRQVAVATKKMGFPLQLKIDHFDFQYRNGKTTIKVSLADVPAQMKDKMEGEANKLIRSTPVGAFLSAITYDTVREGIEFLKERSDEVATKKTTDEYADFFVKGYNQSFGDNLKLRGVMVRLDRHQRVISGIKFAFTNKTTLLAKLSYTNTKVPEIGLFVPALAQTAISQTAFKSQRGVQIPQRVTIRYWDYEFRERKSDSGGGRPGAGGGFGAEPGPGAVGEPGGGAGDPW